MSNEKNPNVFKLEYHLYYPNDFTPRDATEVKHVHDSAWARGTALTKSGKKGQSVVNYMLSHCDKELYGFTDYASDPKKTTGLFNATKVLSKDEKKQFEEKLKGTTATIYEGFFSFSPDLYEKIKNANDAKNAIQNAFPKLLETAFKKEKGYSPKFKSDDFEWVGAIHTDTDHIHCHVLFFEKNPNYNGPKGPDYYTSLHPKFNIENVQRWKSYLEKQVLDVNFDLKFRDVFMDGFREEIKDKSVADIIHRHGKTMSNFNVKQFARLTNENKKIVRECFDDIINFVPELKQKYQEFENKIDDYVSKSNAIDEKNKVKFKNNFKENRMDDLFNRCANDILKIMILDKNVHLKKANYRKTKNKMTKFYAQDKRLIREKSNEIRLDNKQKDRDINKLISLLSDTNSWLFNYSDLADTLDSPTK